MGTKRVLLVDDEDDFLEVIGMRIKSWGYDLITATNGKDAVDLLSNKSPDIVILDYLMPEMNGVDTLKKMRSINRNIPVVMLTAYPDTKSIKGTERLGVSAFIPKFSVYSDTHYSLRSILNMIEKNLQRQK